MKTNRGLPLSQREGHLLWINHFAVTPGDGGGTRHFEIGRELLERGWRVTIAASDFHLQSRRYTRRRSNSDRAVIQELVEEVEFQWLWAASYTRNDLKRVRNWFSFTRSLLRWRPAAKRPDVVIGSSPHLFAAFAGYRMARRWQVPFIFEVRDLWPESVVAVRGRKGPAYHALDALARYLYARADRIICLARGAQMYLTKRGVDRAKLVYIPNGVDPAMFTETKRPDRDTFTLVYAGAHGPANGLHTILKAASLLLQQDHIRFLLVGDGPVKDELVNEARARELSNVEFRDPIPKSHIPDLFSEADAGLMILRNTPLFTYGVSPNKLFDYFGAALPVVCNVPGEVAAMIEESRGGVQADPGSAESLADAIIDLANRTYEERKEIGRAAREWVQREHSRAVLADRLNCVLREVVESV